MASTDDSLVIDNFEESEIAALLLVCAGILTSACYSDIRRVAGNKELRNLELI